MKTGENNDRDFGNLRLKSIYTAPVSLEFELALH